MWNKSSLSTRDNEDGNEGVSEDWHLCPTNDMEYCPGECSSTVSLGPATVSLHGLSLSASPKRHLSPLELIIYLITLKQITFDARKVENLG